MCQPRKPGPWQDGAAGCCVTFERTAQSRLEFTRNGATEWDPRLRSSRTTATEVVEHRRPSIVARRDHRRRGRRRGRESVRSHRACGWCVARRGRFWPAGARRDTHTWNVTLEASLSTLSLVEPCGVPGVRRRDFARLRHVCFFSVSEHFVTVLSYSSLRAGGRHHLIAL